MMIEISPKRYCIDTSAIIELYRGKYTKKTFKTLWEDVNTLFDEGRIHSPREVYDEIKNGTDELPKWAKSKRSLFTNSEEEVLTLVKELVNHVNAWKNATGSKDFADPFIVAHAKIYGLTVITEESDQRSMKNIKAGKIPGVCQEYGVKCIRLIQLTKYEDWEY